MCRTNGQHCAVAYKWLGGWQCDGLHFLHIDAKRKMRKRGKTFNTTINENLQEKPHLALRISAYSQNVPEYRNHFR